MQFIAMMHSGTTSGLSTIRNCMMPDDLTPAHGIDMKLVFPYILVHVSTWVATKDEHRAISSKMFFCNSCKVLIACANNQCVFDSAFLSRETRGRQSETPSIANLLTLRC